MRGAERVRRPSRRPLVGASGPGFSEAPFSEPREWTDCGECAEARDFFRALTDKDEDALAPYPKCGQPPRCFAGSAPEDRHCPRPATTSHGIGLCCGQHFRAFELECDEDEWTQAKRHLRHLCGLAKSVGNSALEEVLDLAWAETEMRIAAIEAEQELLWSW